MRCIKLAITEERKMYDVNSKCPDDFINHEEILTTLATLKKTSTMRH